jgi:S1-C subfamily serine protease
MIRTLMQRWYTDLIGLVVGFALGGAALVHAWPTVQAMHARLSNHPVREPAARPPASRPAPILVVAQPGMPVAAPDPALAPEPADAHRQRSEIVYPEDPENPGVHGRSGTGFFVDDHLLITAAHVVPGCGRAEILSQFVSRTTVKVVARQPGEDIALLRVNGVKAPATLAIGRPEHADDRVFVLGFPITTKARTPVETWGDLRNHNLPPGLTGNPEPGEAVWMTANGVQEGFSGGPIFDPATQKVIGIVRAGVEFVWHDRGGGTAHLETGPGAAQLSEFLEEEALGTEGFPAGQWGEDPLNVVRRATVRVFCWP